MKRKIFFRICCFLILFICFLFCIFCAGTNITLNEVDNKLINSNTEFGFKIFSELNMENNEKENIFISPLSISLALSMVYNGAMEDTKEAMRKTLEFEELTLNEINESFAKLINYLKKTEPMVKLLIANSIWGRDEVEFGNDFIKSMKEYYQAKVVSLPFDNNAIKQINQWVKENTKGKIEKIIAEINPDDMIFLINAIYFKGEWGLKFDEANTQNKIFNLMDGSKKEVPMMHNSEEYAYLQEEKFKALRLVYGKEDKMSMYIFLPNKDVNLFDFIKDLNTDKWNDWMNKFYTTEVDIVIPKFKIEYERKLNNDLKKLGMEIAFNYDANFKAMCSNIDLHIGYVLHKAVIEVNEEGTEAAAVTAVSMVDECISEPTEFIADRPFFFAIRDDNTGTILFMGTLLDPEY